MSKQSMLALLPTAFFKFRITITKYSEALINNKTTLWRDEKRLSIHVYVIITILCDGLSERALLCCKKNSVLYDLYNKYFIDQVW